MNKKTILILSANPEDIDRLRLDKEIKAIKDNLLMSPLSDEFTIKQSEAIRLADLYRAMLHYKPHYVHFCGHGDKNGIVLEKETGETDSVTPEKLANIFKQFTDNLICVILNACHTENHAKAIAEFIPNVIGTNESPDDDDSIKFADIFYIGLFGGKSIKESRNAAGKIGSTVFFEKPENLIKPTIKTNSIFENMKNIFF